MRRNFFAFYKTLACMAAVVFSCASTLASSLPQDGLCVHFRADDQSALNNGAGAGQWHEVTNWQGGGAASPLLKRVVIDGAEKYAPHFVTNGFTRADGTAAPGVRFCLNEDATDRFSSYTPLATDEMWFGIDQNESTWFFAFRGYNAGHANMHWKDYWGMADVSAKQWYYGLATFEDVPNSAFFAWGGATVKGSSFISAVPVESGTYLIDVRDRYKTRISSAYVNGELINTANWVETVAQPVACRLAIGNAHHSLDSVAYATAPMDVGELAIYNRVLNDAECVIVREALTARWGLTNGSALYTGASGGYCDELVAVGSSTATGSGRIPGAVETSGSSDGLTLSVADGTLAGKDGYIFAAHDGEDVALVFDAALARRRCKRYWRIESTVSPAPPVVMTFDLSDAGLGPLSDEVVSSVALVRRTGGTDALSAPSAVSDAVVAVEDATVSFSFAAGALKNGIYTLAFSASPVQVSSSLPDSGLCVHFRADDQSALNNGAGAGQWHEVTNWQGGGAASPLLKRVVIDGAEKYAPHFVTNGFTRADGTAAPGVRFCLNEDATDSFSSYTPLATDEMQFGIDQNESTWFFAFRGYNAGKASMHWKDYWGMADASANQWYYGLSTRQNNSGTHIFYACGGAKVLGSSFITAVPVTPGTYLIDVRDRYKTNISSAYVNGELINTANWVETVAQPVACRLAIGNAYGSLDSVAYATAPIDVGELAIYNRVLNDAECVIVREALTARWGLTNGSALYTGASGGYCDELVAVGSSTATGSGRIAGAVETSGSSCGLTLAVTPGALDGADGYVFAASDSSAHAGTVNVPELRMTRMNNKWRLEKTGFPAWPEISLFFALPGNMAGRVSEAPESVALLRLSDGEFEVVQGVEAVYDGISGTLAFGCPAGTLSDGVYTVGVLNKPGLSLIVR